MCRCIEKISLTPDGLAFEKNMTKKKKKSAYNFGFLAVCFLRTNILNVQQNWSEEFFWIFCMHVLFWNL